MGPMRLRTIDLNYHLECEQSSGVIPETAMIEILVTIANLVSLRCEQVTCMPAVKPL